MPELNEGGLLKGANALTEDFMKNLNKVIEETKKSDKVTIIVYENPPYAETTSIEHQKRKVGEKNSTWKQNYVVEQMKEYIKSQAGIPGSASNDMGNAFIWSAFEYLLKEPADSLIVYSPVKYWKAHHLINKEFIEGYAVNRKHFHAKTDACIMIALWTNIDKEVEKLTLKARDITTSGLSDEGLIEVLPVYSQFSETMFDSRTFPDDVANTMQTVFTLEQTTLLRSCQCLHQREPDRNGKIKKVYNDGDLNNLIKSFKKKLKNYYINNLVDTLFEYEFLK